MNEILDLWVKCRNSLPLDIRYPYVNLMLTKAGLGKEERDDYLSKLTPEKYKDLLEILGEI
jgi:hypothetical protein